MKLKKFFLWTLAATMAVSGPVFVTSCTNDDNPTVIEDEDEPYVPQQQTIVPLNTPAYVSDISEADYSKTVNALFPLRGSLDKVDIAVVTPAELGTYDGQLYDLYQRGGLIVIARPDGSNYKKFVEQYGLKYKMPETDSLDVFAFAFNKNQRFYCIYDYKYPDGEPKDKSYYVQLFNSFGEWVRENYESPAYETRALRRANSVDDNPLTPHVNTSSPDESYYLYWPTHVWQKVASSPGTQMFVNGDQNNHYVWDNGGYGGIRVATNVWYFYSYSDDQNIGGDYYLIQSSVTAENSGLWRPNYFWHGKGSGAKPKIFVIGYFMTKMDVDYRMCDWVEPQFPNTGELGNPSPGTTIRQTAYTHGFSWGLSGSISAGYSAGTNGQSATTNASITGSFGWNIQYSKSKQETYSDFNLYNKSDGSKGYVTYSYQIYNFNPSRDWDKQKVQSADNGYPAISWSNMYTYTSWLWRVPKGTHGDKGQHTVADGSDTEFDVQVTVVPKYGTNHWWRGQGGYHFFDDNWPNSDIYSTYESLVATLHLSHPIRIPFGELQFQNGHTHDVVMDRITLWDNDANPSTDACLDSIEGAYGPGKNIKWGLVEGKKYKVRYELKNTSDPDTIKVIGFYERRDISIHSGEDEKSGTTIISTTDSQAVKIGQ